MIITKKHLSRRTFLRGTFGAAIALPMLDAMVPAMTAQGRTAAASKFHFGAVYVPNGVLPERWHPEIAGANFDIKAPMAPLEPFRDQLVAVSGMTAPPGSVHLGASAAWLNGVGPKGRNGEQIESETTLDQFIAARWGQDTPLPSIEVGTEDMGTAVGACDGYACLYFNTLSWRNATSPLPIEVNPRVTFERMFGETGNTSQRAARLRYRRSMLDAVTQEATRLRSELGPADRTVLSEYLDNIREVERRLEQLERRSAYSVIDLPAAPNGVPELVDDHIRLTYDLMHLAFAGDISRVFTFLTGVEASNRSYPHIGVPESHHNASHHGGDAAQMDRYTAIVTYHMSMLASFLEKLKNTPDGDGSLLDHSLIYYGSGMSNGNAHDRNNPPAALIGGANGRLKGNQHVHVDNREPVANLLLGIADLADVELEKIGPSTGRILLT